MTEQILQKKVCDYIQEYYPNVYFDSDPSGIRVSMGIRLLLKATRSKHNHLDIFIAEPSREFKGLFIELKIDSPYLKNGDLSTDKHIRNQYATMQLLESKGFMCIFAWSLDQVINILNTYLGEPVQDNTPLF